MSTERGFDSGCSAGVGDDMSEDSSHLTATAATFNLYGELPDRVTARIHNKCPWLVEKSAPIV
jgi:hypothetical protein